MNLSFLYSVGMVRSMMIFQQLGMVLKSGMPLVRGLSLLEEELPSSCRQILRHLRVSVGSGHPLAEAMRTCQWSFPPLAIHLVETGELSGTLAESMQTLAKYLRRSHELKRKILSAILYPSFIVFALVGLLGIIGLYVLPRLLPIFATMKMPLPVSTRILLWGVAFMEDSGFFAFIACVGLFLLFLFAIRHEPFRTLWHRFKLRIPFIGVIQSDGAMQQVAMTLGLLLKSGVPVVTALPVVASVMGNVRHERAIRATIPLVEAGNSFADALKKTGGNLFPSMMVAFLDMGEETGTFTNMLDFLTEYYEGEVDYAVKNFTIAIEPTLLIFIAVIVGWIVLAIVNPIYAFTSRVAN